MPGLNQLKQFNSDILNLGDEVKIRSARGEKPVTVKIPKKITVADDSADFANGMPFVSEEEFQQAEAAAAEREREKYNVEGLFDDGSSAKKESASAESAAPAMPDVSDILNPGSDLDIQADDLSDFEDPVEEEEEEEEEKVTPIEDMDLDSLLSFSGDGTVSLDEDEEEDEEEQQQQESEAQASADSSSESEDDFDLASFASAFDATPAAPEAEPPAAKVEAPVPEAEPPAPEAFDSPASIEAAAPLETVESASDDAVESADAMDIMEDSASAPEGGEAESFDMDGANSDFAAPAEELDLSQDLPDDLKEEPDPGALAAYEERKQQESEPEALDEPAEEQTFDVGDLDNPDFSDQTAVAEPQPEEGVPSALDESLFSDDVPAQDESVASDETELPVADIPSDGEALSDLGDLADMDGTGDVPGRDATGMDDMQLPDMDSAATGMDDMQLPDMDSAATGADDMQLPDMDSAATGADDMQLPDMDSASAGEEPLEMEGSAPLGESLDEPEDGVESFDTSGMDGVDFDAPVDTGGDFELGNITAQEGNEEFSIPGFSDTVTANLNKKAPEPEVSTEDGEGSSAAPTKPKNTFTDAEYKQFLANLEHYPLNIRLAVELFATKSDFTDDAQFEIFEEVLKKVPAKKLASDLEKLLSDEDLQQLGIQSLSVPKDFERRSNEEWEAYKRTPQYQLKNRILPLAIISTAAAILLFCIWILSDNFVYKPLMARHFYKQGYELIQENMYPQSEDKFNRALVFRSVKDWFYKYAASYREHKQYDRAENMYRQILKRFKQDKPAGLALADMLANDMFNYPEAEKVLKREVLDYFVNDYDGIMQLGDTYLSWADDDPSKFDDAKEQYDLLYELYGGEKKLSPKILSRQMRYYVRTDNLPQVLQYKEGFFPDNKNLDPEDLVEVSGYLLDKRYGDLPPSQEYLRSHIEGLRGLLEAAVKSNPKSATALYNLGRYFVRADNAKRGKLCFDEAIDLFNSMRPRSARDTYRLIDTYRLLGEEYVAEEKYIDAEIQYVKGKEIFERENASNKNFRGIENVGKLYADLADINYFTSGNMDVALDNYVKSINSDNDTPTIRYRIGYIQYTNRNYPEALMSFRLSSEGDPDDTHSLLALANTLSLRDDNYAAQGYYEKLLRILDAQRQVYGIMLPQVREDHGDIVDTYMKASNNLGVTLSRIAEMTGNSRYNAQAIVSLQDSLRAWDALSRNQETMVRLGGSNLAEQNIKYITEPKVKYSPEIYTDIPMVKSDEKGL
ncbi:MAG: hypothetical protein ILP18_10525 [Treponema sp.]|nr:hypothetical protein [Treponema sp.]